MSSSAGIWPGSCCSLAVAHGAAVNFRVQESFEITIFLGLQPRGGLAGHVVAVFLVLSRTSTLFSMVAVAHFHFSEQGRRVLFLACPPFLHSLCADRW